MSSDCQWARPRGRSHLPFRGRARNPSRYVAGADRETDEGRVAQHISRGIHISHVDLLEALSELLLHLIIHLGLSDRDLHVVEVVGRSLVLGHDLLLEFFALLQLLHLHLLLVIGLHHLKLLLQVLLLLINTGPGKF